MTYTIENIDGVSKEFTADKDFIRFAQTIFDENEEPETFLYRPDDIESAEHYINTCCSNLELEIS